MNQATNTRGTITNAGSGANPRPTFEKMAKRLYSTHSGSMPLAPTKVKLGSPPVQQKNQTGSNRPGSGTDPRFQGNQTVGQQPVKTLGPPPAKAVAEAPGNQPAKNAPHTKPGTDKENGTPAQMRKVEVPDSTTALKKKRTQGQIMYPSQHVDTSRKL